MRRFFAEPGRFSATQIELSEEESHHLRDVLRLSVGDDVSVFDGVGREFQGTVAEIAKKRSLIDVVNEIAPAAPESPLQLTLAPTMLQGEKYDLIVQKAVELGVTRLIPLETLRGDMKAKDAAKRLARWRRIAMEATKQCGRARLMEIGEPTTFKELLSRADTAKTILFSERDGTSLEGLSKATELIAIMGPKGGWDDKELELAKSRKIWVVTLGGRIMRAETASIALTAILQHRFGDIN